MQSAAKHKPESQPQGWLTLGMMKNEQIVITTANGETIIIRNRKTDRDSIKLAFRAARSISIDRQVYEADENGNQREN